MTLLRLFLFASTLIIFAITTYAISMHGINWPAVYFGDLFSLDWRSQFNADFLIHLILFATWILWREGYTLKGFLFAFLSIFMGGMFGFLYLLLATFIAKGNPKYMLLGVHANK